ncbi:NAD(P)H-dependent oxidoreductase [Lysinibacillus sp. CD3-6]|uniref:FMN-dependent NADH-azoreductase n=1 Tax=Lysinibacillus sp. CD3-6 TaxID=2892541 RepID=UPI00116EAD17|nr:NAD(P)H-dependent oxidoreductase [Lysinibacillus sp. CD3-6]UED81500.1 NAD(P)H-dependent oxidoreductase [Lysinibacillus sp. CD3-6]
MSKLLVINAHPEFDSTTSVSLVGLRNFMDFYQEENSDEEIIEQINLYDDYIPQLDKTIFTAWNKQANNEKLTDEELHAISRMHELVQQFKSANKYVIAYPLHNFNVPSKLKDYMDNILIARETFKYTENGSVGLLNDGRSMVIIQGSGSIYTNNDWYTEVEYSHKYLKSMFNFIGIEDYKIMRVQGSSIINREELLKNAATEAQQLASQLATK